ncbi:phage_rel_nuc, putative phage-type endonuclease [uncultured Caudovirales phage]|uniref:Phage_rel_nuc, putative phage-type endonuclease n=1 Tax=uncultured Caudovirales phage TaxID=2100421 RepID=A0A6J7WJG1_9CAUD|nr:phage_rel_nuc, putative phage-type endonuclease [uncultured Caudovirales phage]
MQNPQQTEQWLNDRRGNVGASRIADIMAKTKSGYSASRANYMAALIVERVTGASQENYTNAAMQWGTDNEPKARDMYQFMTDNVVELTGFVPHPCIKGAGASPDGLVNDDGLVEIKCPNTATHLDALLGTSIDTKYLYQMQFQMACTGRKYCDFVSFDPRLPVELQIKIQRVEYDVELVGKIETEVIIFLSEMAEKLEQLNKLRG